MNKAFTLLTAIAGITIVSPAFADNAVQGDKQDIQADINAIHKDNIALNKDRATLHRDRIAKSADSYKTSSKVQKDSKGNYAEKDITTKTDADGTTINFEKDANVAVDANGDTDKVTTTKKVTDPKGLFNKSTVKTSNTEKTKDDMMETSQEVIVDGKTVESQSKTAPQQ